MAVSGTLFAGEDPRIVRIDGERVDAVPHGRMLVARNVDNPGVLGFIGSILGDNEVNIVGMYNSRRDEPGGEALTIYNLDDPVPDSVVEAILDDDRMIDVTYLTLNGSKDGQ